MTDRPGKPEPLLTQRAALVLLLSVLAAGTVGTLTQLGGHPFAMVMLAGLATLAAATKFFHWLIG